MTCTEPEWIDSINICLNGIAVWMLILLFIDQRRIEKRYEAILPPSKQNGPPA